MLAVQSEAVAGRVSVVVVNYRGTDDTLVCLDQLSQLDYPADHVELICVDNASGDGSLERLRAGMPSGTVLVASAKNTGFAGGCNLGVEHATGEFLAFINNDARPDPMWLAEAVPVLQRETTIGCVASKVLNWEGTDVDFVDAALTWYGMGYKPGAGAPYDGRNEQPEDVLFATGSAMVMRTTTFRALDGFDERYFMFYEDVDLGWRINLAGLKVRYVPTSIVFHKHHASMRSYGAYSEWFLLERNALMTMYKNLSDESLARLLAPTLALTVRRSLAIGGADLGLLDLEQGLRGDHAETTEVSKRSLAGPYAIDSFVDHLPALASDRSRIQATRVRSDRELIPLLRNALEPAIPNERYLKGHQVLVDAFGVAELFTHTHQKIVVVTGDPLARKMAGPAIRAFHIAEELAARHDVKLISTASCTIDDDRMTCLHVAVDQLRPEVDWADIVVFHGFLTAQAPWILSSDKILVIDLYDPLLVEQLEQTRGDEVLSRTRDLAATGQVLNSQLARGDFFLCSSEKQRHFWLGQLAALGRLNPQTYDSDPSMQSLLAVAPFGLPAEPPVQMSSPIKGGAYPGISPSDKVIIWAGGIYNWFDPLTLLHAVSRIADRHPDLRLFFLGTEHPNPLVPRMRMVVRARALAEQLGLAGTIVFFNEGWVDYDRRQDYLLDADLGVSTHFEHIETTFAFRTRILDYLWAGLPMVVTGGDTFGDVVTRDGLGITVPEQEVNALAQALERCLYDEPFNAECRANVERVAGGYTWPVALAPLLEFCEHPHRAQDASLPLGAQGISLRSPSSVRRDLALVRTYLRTGGPRELGRRAFGRIRTRMATPR